MTAGYFISLIIFTVSVAAFVDYVNNDIDNYLKGTILCLLVFFSCVTMTTFALNLGNPRAIDVYRGKTELEITSINGVPQDTVVVWKK